MTDLERFFRRLVANLASTDPARLHRPVPLQEIQQDIVPYRVNRRALQLDTSEDYELVLLRLCAGEGGFLSTEPEEARLRFAREAQSRHPDLGILRAVDGVVVSLRSEPLAYALVPAPEPSYAPPIKDYEPPAEPADAFLPELEERPPPGATPDLDPNYESDLEPEYEPGLEPEPELDLAPAARKEPALQCLYCGGSLPTGRTVNFCPHCGQSQTTPVCPECRSELEPGWKHCVNCGCAVGEA